MTNRFNRSHRLNRIAVATAAASVAALALPGPAVAASTQTADGTADVWQAVYDDHDVLAGWEQAGSPGNADVISTVIRHGAKRITFTVHYASLERGADQNRFITQQRMRFDHGTPATITVDTSNRWVGNAYLTNDRTGNRIPSDAINHAIDYDADTVWVSVPRRALGTPEWVKYTGLAHALSGSQTETALDDHNYLDNALNAGHRSGTGDANTSDRVFSG